MPNDERTAPRLRHGGYFTREDLARAAGQALADEGVSHAKAADELGASHRTAITRAVDPSNPAGVELCARILERWGGYRFDADAPHFRVERVK